MYYVPQQSVPVAQFAPQGWFGDMVARQAPLIGGAVGGLTTELTGHASLGGLAGGATTVLARDYGHLIPFQASPMQAQQPVAYAPQGFWGNMISGVGGAVGNDVGGRTGNIIRDASGLARYLPFEAGPMTMAQPVAQQPAYDQQGFFGRIGGGLVGGAIGNAFGNRALGSAIGGAVGNFLPFEAGPMQAAPQMAYAPQGFWGDMISNVGGAVGNVVGGNTGNIIRDASALGRYLPFSAGPMTAPQVAYAPQGFWGNMISGVGGAVGNVVGGRTGNIIRDASGLARYLPFEAGPMTMAQPAAYDPQGIFGSIGGGLLGGCDWQRLWQSSAWLGDRWRGWGIPPFPSGPRSADPIYLDR